MNRLTRLSPSAGLLLAATALALFYGFCHLAGWREYTCILSGAFPGGSIGSAFFGLAYVAAYLGFTLLAPPLALAGALLAAAKWLLSPHSRSAIGLFLGVGVLLLSGAACRQKPPENQQQPLASPGGSYILTVPIEASLSDAGSKTWNVAISDAAGNLLYKDDASDFSARFNVYWAWDAEERAWLYDSDTGAVYFWERSGDTGPEAWLKTRWGAGKTKEIEAEVYPPASLFPPYAK